MTEPRDTLVGDALRRVDVPDHGADFWSSLESRLAVESDGSQPSHDPDQDGGGQVLELGARPGRPVWSRRAPAVAAAAVLVALAVGFAAMQRASDGDARVGVADRTEEPAPTEPAPAPETTTTAAPPVPVPQATTGELATQWLTLLRAGEVERAHALLDETSRAALSVDAFRGLATDLAEGAGAFADLPSTTIPLIDDEGLAATAVVYTGDVQREGFIETASYGVVVTGDPDDPTRALGVSFGIDGPAVEAPPLTDPAETRTSPLELDVSPTAGATWAIVDGAGEPQRIDDGEASVSLDVRALAGPGTHTVVVVSTEAGRYTSRSFTVLVE